MADGVLKYIVKFLTDDSEKGVKSLTKTLGKMAVQMGVAFATKKVVDFGISSVKAINAQIEAETKLTEIMTTRMDATNSQIQSVKELTQAQQQLGIVGDEVQIAGAQQLSTFLTQTDSIETLIPAMNNLIAHQNGVNATQGDAINLGNMMGKVFTGQVGALTRVGISFNEAQEEILKYGTEAEKAATLAEVITNNVGNMNEALAKTPEGQMKQLSNTFGDIKESVGTALLPVVTEFAEILKDNMPMISEFLVDVFSMFSETLVELMPTLSLLIGSFIMIGQTLQPFLKIFLEIIQRVLPVFVELFNKVLLRILPVAIELFDKIADILIDSILPIFDDWIDVIFEIIDALLPVISEILPIFAELLSVIAEEVLPKLIPFILILADMFVNQLLPAIMPLLEMLSPLIGLLMDLALATLPLVMEAFEILMPVIEPFLSLLSEIIDFIVNIFTGNWQGAWENIGNIFTGIWDTIKAVFNATVDGIKLALQTFINFFIDGLNNLIEIGNSLGLEMDLIQRVNFVGAPTGDMISTIPSNFTDELSSNRPIYLQIDLDGDTLAETVIRNIDNNVNLVQSGVQL